MSADDLAVVLLAAGRSTRFGAADKLAAELWGQPLLRQSARALEGLPARRRLVMLRNPSLSVYVPDFEPVHVATAGLGETLRLAFDVLRAGAAPARILVALGDMPCVPPAHYQTLADAPARSASALTSAPDKPRAPACLMREDGAALAGDRGAAALLAGRADLHIVTCPCSWLVDVDDAATLAQLSRRAPPQWHHAAPSRAAAIEGRSTP